MADTLKDFLVGLGFKIDQQGLTRFHGAIAGSHKLVRDFAISIAGLAVAAEESVRRTVRQFENLFYLSQQSGVSVRSLQQLRFTFGQVGSTAEEAAQQVVAFATGLRDNPGLRGLANQLVPGWKDAGDIVKALTGQYRQLMDRFGETGETIEAQAIPLRNYIRLLGLNAETIRQNALNYVAFQRGLRDSEAIYRAFGLDSEKAARQATEASRAFGRVWETIKTAFNVFIVQTFPTVDRLLTQFANWMGTEGAAKIKEWANQFGAWLNKEVTIKNLETLIKNIGDIVATIAKGFENLATTNFSDFNTSLAGINTTLKDLKGYIDYLVEWIKWLNDPANTPWWLDPNKTKEQVRPFVTPRNAPHPDRPTSPIVEGFKFLWDKMFGGSSAPSAGPSRVLPGSPEFTAPVPGRQGSLAPGLRASPAAFGGTGGDVSELLLRGLANWWSGSTAFRPIVVLADEVYNKIADAIARSFGLAPGTPLGAGGADGGAGGPMGATPGRGRVGRFGGSMRFRPGSGAALPGSVFEAISQAEGTFKNGQIDYDAMLGNVGGPLGTPPKPISQMTIAELLNWQTQMLRNPNNKWNSSAAGAFQIVSTNIRAALREGRVKETDIFDKATQEQLASHIWRTQGSGAWEGFKQHENLRKRAIELSKGPTPASIAGKLRSDLDWLNKNAPFPTIGNTIRAGDPIKWTDKLPDMDKLRQDPASYGPGSPFGRVPPMGTGGNVSSSSTSVDSKHNVNINVHGTNDQHATARAVRDTLGREYAMYARNLKTQLA